MMAKEQHGKPAKVLRKIRHPGKPKQDAERFLNPGCRWELEELAQRLEHLGDPEELWDLEIERVDGEIHRLLVTGGIFGEEAVEMYFADLASRGEVWILGVDKGRRLEPPPSYRVRKMRNRLNHYKEIEH